MKDLLTPDRPLGRTRTARWGRALVAGLLLGGTAAQAQTPATFAPVTTYAYGTGTNTSDARGVALGDVNADGRLDIVTANIGSANISVLLGQAGGGFAPAPGSPFSAGSNTAPSKVRLGDVNGDSRLDIVTANDVSNNISVLLGQAGGGFAPAAGSPFSYGSGSSTGIARDLVLGDVNGDSRLDIVTANDIVSQTNLTITTSVLLGQAGGSFALAPGSPFVVAGSGRPTAVALGDVNGDSRPDIATALDNSTVVVLLGQAGGGFAPAAGSPFATGPNTSPLALALGDVNGDSRLDLVTGNSSRDVSVLLGQAGGGFAPAAGSPFATNASNGALGVALGDVNGDGRPDIVTGNDREQVVVLLGQASGGFAPTTGSPFSTGNNFERNSAVALGDVNGDGKPDIVTAKSGIFGPARSGAILLNTTAFPPALTGISPLSGAVGTSVTLTGTNLTGATQVTFGGTSNNTVTTGLVAGNNGTTLTVAVPSGAATGNVTVTTPNGVSNGVSFTVTVPATTATVTTTPATNLTTTSATLGGNVTADGGAAITERGVVYVAGTGTPTTSNLKLTTTGTTGAFTVNATGLSAGTQYTVRAYATNSAGTSYGSSQSFTTTQAATAAPVVTAPANNSLLNTTMPPYAGTAPAGSSVTVLVDGTSIGTATANGSGAFSLTQPTALAQGSHTVRATAQSSGSTVSASSNTNTFTVDTAAPTATISSPAGASGGSTSTSPVPFTVTFSEPVTNFSTSGVVAGGGAVTGFNGSGTTYNVLVTANGPGPVSLSVVANQAQDAAGNGNTATAAYSLTYAPAVTDLTISTGTATSPVAIAAGTYNNITVTGTGTGILTGAVVVNGALLVQDGGTLNTNCQPLTGAGSFTLAAGGTLGVCDISGISTSGNAGAVRVTGTRSFSDDANYVYSTAAASFWGGVTGPGLPAIVRSVRVTSNRLYLSQPLSVRREVRVEGGDLNLAKSFIDNTQQALTLLSDATGTALVVNGGTSSVIGTAATMQRYLSTTNTGPGYRHYSSPMNGNTLADLATATFTPEFNQAYNSSATPGTTVPFPTVFGYDQARLATATNNLAAFDKGFFVPTAATPFTPGTGYAVNLNGTEKVDFTGTANNGNYTRSLSRDADPAAGWQLVGNPYPAPLDWSLVQPTERLGLDASMYVYESTGPYVGNYRSYVNGIGNALIGSSQGFFVRVSQGQTTGTLTFSNAQRVTSYATQVDVRRGAADARPQLRLELAGQNLTDALTVYAEAGATAGADAQFDAVKLANPSGLNLASLTAAGQQLAIDGRAGFAATTAVPLFVGVPAAGAYAFTAAELANLAGTRAELVDNLTGTRTLLTTGTRYAFTTATTTAPGRFWLNLTPAAAPLATSANAALAAQVLAYPNPAHDRLTVVRPAGPPATAVLFNTLGQVVKTVALPTAETTVDVSGLATGVYSLRLTLDGQTITRRVVLN